MIARVVESPDCGVSGLGCSCGGKCGGCSGFYYVDRGVGRLGRVGKWDDDGGPIDRFVDRGVGQLDDASSGILPLAIAAGVVWFVSSYFGKRKGGR